MPRLALMMNGPLQNKVTALIEPEVATNRDLFRLDAQGPHCPRAARRSVTALLRPLDEIASQSARLTARGGAAFDHGGESYELPRYQFCGPRGGDEPLRIGIFAGVHGDEPEGIHALIRFLILLEDEPELATGYSLSVYPVCNPTGVEDGTRHSRSGKDLNREFWRDSNEPEVRLLESELLSPGFDGIIALHTDDTSQGFYGFANGATLTRNLIEPALRAASDFLPRNQAEQIDGFRARNGVIRKGYEGVLSAPPKMRPRPFEITLETPQTAPNYLKEAALVAALRAILAEYRAFIAHAANL